MKHWTENLSEGKRIFESEVNYLRNLKLRIANLKSQVEIIESEINVCETDLLHSIKKQYTSEEIDEAINQFTK